MKVPNCYFIIAPGKKTIFKFGLRYVVYITGVKGKLFLQGGNKDEKDI